MSRGFQIVIEIKWPDKSRQRREIAASSRQPYGLNRPSRASVNRAPRYARVGQGGCPAQGITKPRAKLRENSTADAGLSTPTHCRCRVASGERCCRTIFDGPATFPYCKITQGPIKEVTGLSHPDQPHVPELKKLVGVRIAARPREDVGATAGRDSPAGDIHAQTTGGEVVAPRGASWQHRTRTTGSARVQVPHKTNIRSAYSAIDPIPRSGPLLPHP